MLGAYYRLPNKQQEMGEHLGREIAEMSNKNKVTVLGDFNFPNVNQIASPRKSQSGQNF